MTKNSVNKIDNNLVKHIIKVLINVQSKIDITTHFIKILIYNYLFLWT